MKEKTGVAGKLLAAGLILPCLLLSCIFISTTFVSADNPLTVRVGIYENKPKIFTDEQGSPSGFWVDITEYIALKEGWKLQYVHGTWQQCLARLESGEIDMMPDVAYTEERAEKYEFSREPVYTSWSEIYCRPGSRIESILDLENKNIAVMKGSVNYEGPEGIKQLVKSYNINCAFVEVESYQKVFELVRDGGADAGVVSKDFGHQHETQYRLAKTAIIFQPSLLYYAFPKGSSLTPHLIERIDYNVRVLKDDGKSLYYQSLARWFGVKPSGREVIPMWLIWALAAAGTVALLLVAGNLILRAQVASRTRELKEEIEERKQAEEKLARYRQHLEELVEARTAELQQKNLELEQANIRLQEIDRLKSVFLASMSHELRTPLNSIIGFTGILLQGMAGDLNDEQRKQLSIIKSSASHLLNLINDVLDISRIEAGRVELFPEEFKLDDMVQDIVHTFSPMVDQKGLQLLTEIPEGISLVTDKRRLKQALINLVSNAVKFTDKGIIRLSARVLDGTKLELRVSDTGTGIREEDMTKLFEPFQQIGASLTKRHEGTGLGLYLTRKLADLLGGDITAKSQYGQGSEFTLTIPLRYTLAKEAKDETHTGG